VSPKKYTKQLLPNFPHANYSISWTFLYALYNNRFIVIHTLSAHLLILSSGTSLICQLVCLSLHLGLYVCLCDFVFVSGYLLFVVHCFTFSRFHSFYLFSVFVYIIFVFPLLRVTVTATLLISLLILRLSVSLSVALYVNPRSAIIGKLSVRFIRRYE